MIRMLLAAAAVLALPATGAMALTITGTAEVVDSDIVLLGGYRVFFLGVESIEENQNCRVGSQEWQCWAPAVRALQQIAFEGAMTCEAITNPDPVNQVIATCTVNGEDVGGRLVREGWAIALPAETSRYLDEQTNARLDRLGLWQSIFTQPFLWRRANGIFVDRPAFVPVVPVE